MEFLDPDFKELKEVVNLKVCIVDLMKRYGLELEESEVGQDFTHRTYCPFHSGKDGGRERTPSLYISKKTNSFFCYGCCNCGKPIDFVSLIDGSPQIIAMRKLAKDVGLMNKNGEWDELQLESLSRVDYSFDPSKTIELYIIDTSNAIREHIKRFIGLDSFEKEFRWAEKISKRLDEYLGRIGYEDWEDAMKLRDIILRKIRKRLELK